MLDYPRMYKSTVTYTALIGLACLLLIPTSIASASSLREQAVAYRIQGYEAQERGEKAEALSLYQKAVALDPSYPAPSNDLGIIREEQGDLKEAEKMYRQALDRNPDYFEAHANLAMLYERMGDKEKAIYHWLKRYQLGDEDDPWTLRAEERLMALGVLQAYPGMKGTFYTRHRAVSQEFENHAKSLKDFHVITEQQGDWP